MKTYETSITNENLRRRLGDPQDQEAWFNFASIYRPMFFLVGRRLGLLYADAENLAQIVMNKVGGRVPNERQGSLRAAFFVG